MPEDKCDFVKEWHIFDYWGKPTMNTTFIYDSQGRIIHVDGEDQNQSTFTYTKTTIKLDATAFDGEKTAMIFYLDGKGRITHTDKYSHNCKYDAEGHLISYRIPYGYNGTINGYTTYTLGYENGNLVKITAAEPGVTHGNVDLSYLDKPAQENMGYNSPLYLSGMLGARDYFLLIQGGYFGKTSKNLLKAIDFHDGYTRADTEYTFDAKGRVQKTQFFGFKYQCD